MNTYLVRRRIGATTHQERVVASTPQAAARKIFGRAATFASERETMAGAIRTIDVENQTTGGQVEWANRADVRLVQYVERPDSEPFWTVPEAWLDADKHALTVLG